MRELEKGMSRINVPLLRKTLEHIEAHPSEWDQNEWAQRTTCGTTLCFAGWAVTFAGHNVRFLPESDVAMTVADGRTIEAAAVTELGLEWWEAGRLFYTVNDLGVLREHVAELLARADRDES